MTTAGFGTPAGGGLSININGVAVQDWTATGPVAMQRSQQWTTAAVGSGAGVTALSFSAPASTPAALAGYLTYAPSAVNGDTWTINQAGWWSVTSVLNVAGGGNTAQAFLTRNSTATAVPTTGALTPAVTLGYNTAGQTGTQFVGTGGTYQLAAGDVVRLSVAANNAATTIGTGANCQVTFTYLGATAATL